MKINEFRSKPTFPSLEHYPYIHTTFLLAEPFVSTSLVVSNLGVARLDCFVTGHHGSDSGFASKYNLSLFGGFGLFGVNVCTIGLVYTSRIVITIGLVSTIG